MCEREACSTQSANKQLEKFQKIEVHEIFLILIIVYQDRKYLILKIRPWGEFFDFPLRLKSDLW